MPKITVITQVYNTKAYLPACIESVLNQTFSNFEYILVDNGSTDGCAELMAEYAAKDPRVRVVSFEKNIPGGRLIPIVQEQGRGEYVADLDSDDWWDPDYLERLLNFAETYNLDMACTGCVFHPMPDGPLGYRKLENAVVLNRTQFADGLPCYHAFLRPVWGKLIRRKSFCDAGVQKYLEGGFPYGKDTLICFSILRVSQRLGIDCSTMYHYRLHQKSVSFEYDPKRFDADVYLYNDAVDFLSAYGPVSARNRWFLQVVYANALSDTLGVIANAALSPAEKLKECRAIATHPLTRETCLENRDDSVTRCRDTLLAVSLQAGVALGGGDDGDLREITRTLLPCCGGAVTKETVGLFLSDPAMRTALARDDADALAAPLLDLIEAKRYTKQYDLGKAVQALAQDKPPLRNVDDTGFLRKYRDIYWAVWQGRAAEALDTMTGLLLDGKLRGAEGTFLEVYLSLAAMENQEAAFLFGKTMLARLYLRRREREKCQAVLSELEEIGMEDNADLAAIRQGLADMR